MSAPRKIDIAAMASNLAAGALWKISGAFCVSDAKPSPGPRFEALAGMSQGYRGLRHGEARLRMDATPSCCLHELLRGRVGSRQMSFDHYPHPPLSPPPVLAFGR